MPRHDRRSKPYCNHCGGPKPPGRGRKLCDTCPPLNPVRTGKCRECGGEREKRQQLCNDCKELHEWRRKTRAKVRKRKPCSDCGGPKPEGKRLRYCPKCTAKRKAKRPCENCKKRPKRYPTAKLCVLCKLEALAKVRARNRLRHHDERIKAAAALKAKGRKPKPRKVTQRRRRELNEDHRMSKRMRAERAGTPIAPLSEEQYVAQYGHGMNREHITVEPIRPLLEEVFDLAAFAESAGVSLSLLVRIVNGTYDEIRLREADRIYTSLGLPMSSML